MFVFAHLILKNIKTSNAEPAVFSKGFSNWRDATMAFNKHELSACHNEAVDVMITIPATTKDVGEQLSKQYW